MRVWVKLRQQWRQRVKHWIELRIPAASSVQLSQRQIFIVPTLYSLLFIAMLCALMILAINFENSLIYGLVFLLFSLLSVSLLHTWRNIAGITIRANGVKPVFCDEIANFHLVLESQKKSHYAVSIQLDNQHEIADVESNSTAMLTLALPATQRGWLHLPRFRIETRFPLGLFVAWSEVDLDQHTLCYPRPITIDWPIAATAPTTDESMNVLTVPKEGVEDFAGLQEYYAGAAINRIYWKALSKGQGLMVKRFHAQAGSDVWLDYDAFSGDIELRLSYLCHWVLTLNANQQPFGLRLPGVEIMPQTGESHVQQCLATLALWRK